MIAPRLFLGIPLTNEELKAVESEFHRMKVFFQTSGDLFLDLISEQDRSYLGKWIPPNVDLSQLEQLRSNVLSIATRLLKNPKEPEVVTLLEENLV